jgi:hypothetical protein
MKTSFGVLAAVCVYFCASVDLFAGNVSFVNNNPAVTIVPYGGTYIYSVTWNATGYASGLLSFDFDAPSYQYPYNNYPTNYTFNYTINGVAAANVGNYYVAVNSVGYYSPNYSPDVALYVSPAILTQPQNTVCLNGSATTMGIAAGPSTATFQWFDAGTGSAVNSAGNSPSFTPTIANNGQKIYCKIYNNYGSINSTSAIVTVGSTPAITKQPFSVGTNYGSPVSFTVTASGTQPLYYLWYKNGISISGANLNYLTFPSVTNTDAGTYQVEITNIYGSTNSASVILTVANPISVTSQPASLIVSQGQTATFNVTATGDSLNYQWMLNNNAISGATNNFYTITNTPFSADGGIYSVVITNLISKFTSSKASLTVVGLPIITVQPSDTIAGVGSNITLSVSATAGASPIFYQWFNTNNFISNQTNSSLTLQNIQLTDSGGYYVIITNSFGSVTSSLAGITVQQYAPIIAIQPIGGNVVVGSNFTFIVSASGTTLNYQWQNENGYIAGANANSLTISNVTASIPTNYSVVINNSVSSITSSAAILNVGYLPAIIQQPVSIMANYGGNANFSCIVTGTVPISLQWLENGTSLSGQTNTILTLSNIQSAMAGFQLTATNAFGGTISSNGSINIMYSSYPSNFLQGLVAYFPFIGNANDFIGTNNGTVNGAVLTTDRFGNSNSAYLFNGSSSYIDFGSPSNLDFTSNFTITAWCLFSGGTQNPRIICYGGDSGYELLTDGTGTSRAFQFVGGGQVFDTTLSYTQNVWYSVAAVSQSGTCSIYVNGSLAGSGSVNPPTYPTDFEIGTHSQNGGTDFWGGSIDDVRLYNRALSSNEVSQLFNLESGNIPPQNLSAYFIQNNAFQLEFFGTPNYSYALQATTNLTPPINWQTIITNTTDANGFWNFADTNTVLYPARFYRAMVP